MAICRANNPDTLKNGSFENWKHSNSWFLTVRNKQGETWKGNGEEKTENEYSVAEE